MAFIENDNVIQYRIETVTDLVADTPLVGHPRLLTSADLAATAEKLAAERDITIRFLSPLRIVLTPVNQWQFIMDGEVFETERFLAAVVDTLERSWPRALLSLPPLRAGEGVSLGETSLFRTDIAYSDAKKDNGQKRLLGASGSVRLHFKDGVGAWALPLLLAGIVGVGKEYRMGGGRFIIENHPLPFAWPPPPARTLLERACSGSEAWPKALPPDAMVPRPEASPRGARETLRDVLQNGSPRTEPLLTRFEPTARDNSAQAALLDELRPALNELRRDHIAVAEAKKILTDPRELDWAHLRTFLTGLFGDDPAVDLMMECISAPFILDGKCHARHSELPLPCHLSFQFQGQLEPLVWAAWNPESGPGQGQPDTPSDLGTLFWTPGSFHSNMLTGIRLCPGKFGIFCVAPEDMTSV